MSLDQIVLGGWVAGFVLSVAIAVVASAWTGDDFTWIGIVGAFWPIAILAAVLVGPFWLLYRAVLMLKRRRDRRVFPPNGLRMESTDPLHNQEDLR